MPTPLELVLDPISLTILALYAGLMLWEAVAPGRRLPRIAGSTARGLLSFTAFFFLSSYLPLLWDARLAPYQLLDLTALGTAAGTVVGLLVYELGAWVWHRSLHAVPALWRGAHQMHHSAERIDSYGAFYFSPLDMVGWTALGSFCLVVGVGVSAEAATNILIITNLLAIFQHTNVKTPRWLGYIVQRPESHTVHHGRGVHAGNYSDLPLFDIAFGTFVNPEGYELKTGFYDGASARVAEMIAMRDVTEPPAATEGSSPGDTALTPIHHSA